MSYPADTRKASSAVDGHDRVSLADGLPTQFGSMSVGQRDGSATPTPKPGRRAPKPDPSNGHDAQGESPSRLQANAASFQPNGKRKAKPTPIQVLNQDSEPMYPNIVNGTTPIVTNANSTTASAKSGDHEPIGASRDLSPKSKAYFTTDMGPGIPFQGSHYVRIDGIEADAYAAIMEHLAKEFQWEDKILAQKAPASGSKDITAFFCFNSLRAADEAAQDVGMVATDLDVYYISQADYALAGASHGTPDRTSPYDGQALFIATADNGKASLQLAELEAKVRELAETFGEVRALALHAQPSSKTWHFRAEYDMITEAFQAISLVHGVQPARFNGYTVIARKVDKAVPSYQRAIDTPQKTNASASGVQVSPTGRTAWRPDSNGNAVAVHVPMSTPRYADNGPMQMQLYSPTREQRFQSAPSASTPSLYGNPLPPRSGSWAPGYGRQVPFCDTEPQCVNIERIRAGLDVRTTIMLRNLPNRWQCDDLKECLDKTSAGNYDFSYLRIDFRLGTNVGYAFVNFTDPVHVISFVQHYVGNEWQPGSWPRKVAQVSYATIQGMDCLIQKFRNSSVMDEFPSYRPKLWYIEETAADPSMIGAEKPFPEPDNYSKKQRSHDNAGALGLYPPRTGQRAGNRPRRGQFDLGNPNEMMDGQATASPWHNNGYAAPMPMPMPMTPGFGYQPAHYSHAPVAPQTPGYPAPFYGNFPAMSMPMAGFANGFQQFTPAPYYGNGYGYQTPGHHGGYAPGPINPASGLRTLSQGRLATRPRNVTVAPGGHDIFGPDTSQQPSVPRSFGDVDGYRQANAQYSNDARAQYSQQY